MYFIDDIRLLKPLQAWRSVRALLADPENTGAVFKVIEALKGAGLARAVARLAASPEGADLLHRKPDILPLLQNRDALRALPPGSVGRAYLQFVESEYLSADGLVAASEEAQRVQERSRDERWLATRLRDIHDLQHVICGYGRDTLGELCLLAFMNAQTPNRGIAFIIFMARRRWRQEDPQFPIDDCIAEGRRIGEGARWFATVHWEERLAEPLDKLRAELGLARPGAYYRAVQALPGDLHAAA